jgi:hypothetical protein
MLRLRQQHGAFGHRVFVPAGLTHVAGDRHDLVGCSPDDGAHHDADDADDADDAPSWWIYRSL